MSGTFTNLLYHLVFSTKRRRPWITPQLKDDLSGYMGGIIRNKGGLLLEANGMNDHVHLLARLKPVESLSETMRDLKASSSKWVNQEKTGIRKFGWQDGYAAFTVSESQATRVRSYIQHQEEHHRTADFKSELITLLEKHGIEYDERWLWD